MSKRVLLVGGTGNLGGLIAGELVKRGAELRMLVRAGSRGKLKADVPAEVVEDPAVAYAGVDTVVSAVQGGPETIVDAQLDMLRRARAAGVKRFIPSDYSYNIFGLAEGENLNSDWRREFARRAELERGDVEVVHVMNGCFLDAGVLYGFLGAFDLQKGEVYLWGDGAAKMEFTTYADAAAYTVEAALSEAPVPKEFFVAGDVLNFAELVAETEAGLGRTLKVVKRGSLADLDTEIAKRMTAEPTNMYAWLPLMYWRGMLSGKGHATAPLQNANYPDIRPVGVRAYAAGM